MFKFLVLISLVSSAFSAAFSAASAQSVNPQIPGINQKNEATKIEVYTNLFDFRVVKDSIVENGYTVERRIKKSARSEDKPEFALIRRDGRTVLEFDRLEHPLSTVFFGVFPFLGKGSRQLFLTQNAPRGGSHLIANLKPNLEIVFDNNEYAVGREDFYAIDLDGDAVFELSFESTAFYPFEPERLKNAGVPLTEIVFRYDAARRKYVPANPHFSDYALRGVDDAAAKIRRDNKDFQLSGALVVVLQYVYAGREADGWAFFDRNYDFADRDEIKSKARLILKNDPVYKFIYQQSSGQNK